MPAALKPQERLRAFGGPGMPAVAFGLGSDFALFCLLVRLACGPWGEDSSVSDGLEFAQWSWQGVFLYNMR